MQKKDKVRVRFAPSPTGDPHIGSVWTAQFNWLFARQHGGQFILRIEDTDQKRLVPGSLKKIYEALAWYNLTPDEGPQQGGSHAPYIQSQRLELYKKHAAQLIKQGSAYYCFCTADRLAKLRQEQTAAKQPPRYDKRCLGIPVQEAQARASRGEAVVIRLNVPTSGMITHQDIIRDDVTFRFDQVDDSVLLKSDGWPTYHLANVVDDHAMEITHVIRAEEWLPSMPKHLLLYKVFGWTPPIFANLPLLLGADRSKLSKRHGAMSALSFRDLGYLSEAMQNFLALMGWHPKGDTEILNRQDLTKQFRLEEVNPSGAIFDQAKLDWLNGCYIRTLPVTELLKRVDSFWTIPVGANPSQKWKLQALSLIQDRLRRLGEVNELINFTFPSVWDDELKGLGITLLAPSDITELEWVEGWLQKQPEPWHALALKEMAIQTIKKAVKKNAKVLAPLRKVLTLRNASPDVFDILALLGKKESLRRISEVNQELKPAPITTSGKHHGY